MTIAKVSKSASSVMQNTVAGVQTLRSNLNQQPLRTSKLSPSFWSVPLRRRTSNLQKGRQLLREGKVSEARDCFTRSVSITPAMAHSLMKVVTRLLALVRTDLARYHTSILASA